MYKDYLKIENIILEVICTNEQLIEINYIDEIGSVKPNKLTQNVIKQLKEYFKGKRKVFDIPLLVEGTAFQKKVLKETIRISYGETISYKNLAEKINKPKAYRAVGNALNKNKIPIIIPCHRIVGTDGKLTGYAGGIDIKKKLLNIEKNRSS